MNPTETPSTESKHPDSLYLRTKITRNGLTIYKRYAPPRDHYYFRLTAGKQRLLRKLHRLADPSFKQARELLDAASAGRFGALAATSSRATTLATVEQICQHYEKHAPSATGVRLRTVKSNINALKLILRLGIATVPVAVAGVSPATSSSLLTRELLESFKSRRLTAAGADELKRRTACVSINSTLRQARSVFAKKLGPDFYSSLSMPDLTKFLAVQFLPVAPQRFRRPAADLLGRLAASVPALKQTDPQSYIIYLLAAGAGLRKGEIAHARVRWIEPAPGAHTHPAIIRVQTESDFHIKNQIERAVPLEKFLADELAVLLAGRQPDDHILSGHMTERTDAVFRRFAAWLSQMGWDRRKKCHELRKLYGDEIAAQAGLRAAQVLLGHRQITTTEGYYADPNSSIKNVILFPQKVA